MKVAGNMNPEPILEGTRYNRYAHSGIPRFIVESPTVPIRMRNTPATKGGFRRLLYVMMNPVAVPTMDAAMEGTIRRKPELVADSRRTAWK